MNRGTIIAFSTVTLLVALISIYKARKTRLNTSLDYFLGSRNLGFWMIGCSLFLTNLSANLFIGENEFVYTTNMTVMCWGMSSVLAMVLVAEFLMPVYLRIGAVTTADFLEKRFDGQTKRIVIFIFLLSYLVNLIPSVLYGCAVAMISIFHIDEYFGLPYFDAIRILVLFIGIIGGLYTTLGGLKAIAVSDVVQGAGMVAGSLFLTWYGFRYLGNGHLADGIHRVLTEKREHLNAIGGAHDVLPFSTLFTGMLLINIYYWGMEQYIVQEALASKDLASCQKGMSLAAVGKLMAPLLLNVPGLIAVHLYPHIENTATVFPKMVSGVLPPIMAGLIAAIVFGGALSTFNAGLNSLGTLFVMNLRSSAFWRKGNDQDEARSIRIGRRFQWLVVVLAVSFSPYILFYTGGFYNYLQKVSSFFSVPVFTVMIMGLVTRRVPAIAAKTGLLFFSVLYVLSQTVIDTGLHYLHVLGILFVVTVVLMLILGKLAPRSEPFSLPATAMVNVQPWKNRFWYFGLLLLMMVAVFVLFSPLGIATHTK